MIAIKISPTNLAVVRPIQVILYDMSTHIPLPDKRRITVIAFEGPLPRVGPRVKRQRSSRGKRLGANRTDNRVSSARSRFVSHKGGNVSKGLSAGITDEFPLQRVRQNVPSKALLGRNTFLTGTTLVLLDRIVRRDVVQVPVFVRKGFFTHLAFIGLDSCVNAHV